MKMELILFRIQLIRLITRQFPFSNPPFAARAYAYLSAAQYDALGCMLVLQKIIQPEKTL